MAVYRVGSNKSSVNNFPVIRPTLDLDFANSKTLDPRITFTRASGGSYVGADGLIKYAGVNEARFDHDPVTGESLGLLIEEARTNLVTRSEDPQSAWSIKSGLTVSNSAFPSPDGNASGMKLVLETNTFQDHYLERLISSVNANQSITFSVFLKAFSRNIINLNLYDGSSYSNLVGSWYNLSTGVAFNFTSVGTGTFQSASVKSWGNGIYQLILTGIPTSLSSTSVRPRIQIINQSTTYLGNNSSGFYIWGAQLEIGSFPTSYIPTEESTRTRVADNAVITGKNFSEWYRQDEGTICIESTNLSVYGGSNRFPYLAQIDDGTNNNRISFDFSVLSNGYRYNFVVTSNGVTLAEIGPAGRSNNSAKWVAGIKSNDFITTTSASPGITYKSSNGTPKNTMNRLQLGTGFGERFTGTIKKLTYYPKRLPNSQLQSLTR